MKRLRHTLLGLSATIGLIVIVESSGQFEPSVAQADQEGTVPMAPQTPMVYDFTLNDIEGKPVSLSQFRGKVLLLVNTASFCGNTPQYTEQLWTARAGDGCRDQNVLLHEIQPVVSTLQQDQREGRRQTSALPVSD
jgi:hypothetical protein